MQHAEVSPLTRVLVMSGMFEGEAAAIVEHGLTPLIWEEWHIDRLEAAATSAKLPPRSVAVHLELDTGMARQGVRGDRALMKMLERLHPESPLRLDGIATHFSSPEDLDSHDTSGQLVRLQAAVELMRGLGHRPQWLHAGNSATLLRSDQLCSATSDRRQGRNAIDAEARVGALWICSALRSRW